LSWRLHDELAREHGGVERWGYRRIRAGELDAQLPSPTILAEGDETRKSDHVTASLPEDLAWLDPATTLSYSSLGNPSNTAQVHPYQFTTSMASLATEKGVKIILGSVTDIHYTTASSPMRSSSKKDGSNVAGAVSGVTYTCSSTPTSTPCTHPATTLILAAGPWTPTLLPSLPITSNRAHSILIQPSPSRSPVSAHALFTSLPSSCNPEIYPRPDSTVYACGPTDSRAPLPPTTALVEVDPSSCKDIREQVSTISPTLRDGDVVVEQACYLPGGGPWVGRVGDGVYVAAGHTCWGIMNAPATGMLVAEMVFEGKAKSANVRGLDPRRVMV
jgi:glycine/D-amino acid oxidase-like deaminating enzyme